MSTNLKCIVYCSALQPVCHHGTPELFLRFSWNPH